MKTALCNEMLQDRAWEEQCELIADAGYDGIELAPFSVDPIYLERLRTQHSSAEEQNSSINRQNISALTQNFAAIDQRIGQKTGQTGQSAGKIIRQNVVENKTEPVVSNVLNINALERKRLLRVAEKNGLVFSGLHWILAKTEGLYLTSSDPVVRLKTTEYFRRLIELAADLNASYMVLGSPMQRNVLPGFSRENAVQFALQVLEPLLPDLERYRVLLTLEPLSVQETNFLTSAAETVDLLEKIGAPEQIALHLDCKAMSAEYLSIPEIIENPRNLAYFQTFHANDPNLQGPGFGNLDFAPICQSLKKVGFDGWIGIEPFDYRAGVERLARESISYLRQFL